jgi:hypothetical protein
MVCSNASKKRFLLATLFAFLNNKSYFIQFFQKQIIFYLTFSKQIIFYLTFSKQIIFYSYFSNFISQSRTLKFVHQIRIEF